MATLPEALELRLAEELSAAVSEGRLNDEDLHRVLVAVESGGTLDYSRLAPAFAYLYFTANFAKVTRAAKELVSNEELSRVSRVLDLGAGSGASSAAIFAALPHVGDGFVLCAVDESLEQLELFRRVVEPWMRKESTSADVELRKTDALDYLRKTDAQWQLIVSSFLLSELTSSQAAELMFLLRERAKHAIILTVDREPHRGRTVLRRVGTKALEDKVAFYDYPRDGLRAPNLRTLSLGTPPKLAAKN